MTITKVPPSLMSGVALGENFLFVRDEKPNNTDAGTKNAGDDTRTLNTEVYNTITGASLDTVNNKVTLPVGVYFVVGRAPMYHADRGSLRLENITDSTVALEGESNYTGQYAVVWMVVEGIVIVSGSAKEYSLIQYSNGSQGTNGLGVAGRDPETREIYTSLKVWKIGE